MKVEDLIKRIQALEKIVLEKPQAKQQERKLIMSVDELNFSDYYDDYVNESAHKFTTFIKLKYIEAQWNEGKPFDWKDGSYKYILKLDNNIWCEDAYWDTHQIFNFHTKEHAELFLETFSNELEIIKTLFS